MPEQWCFHQEVAGAMAMDASLPWDAATRWRQYEAEARVNVIRIAAVGIFYCVHLTHHWAAGGNALLRYFGLGAEGAINEQIHIAVTALAVAWIMIAAIIHRLLLEKVFPRWLMYVSTCADAVLLTAMLVLASGAASPLVFGYLLIVMMAGLRLNLRLIWTATAAALVGYLIVLGVTRWPQGLAEVHDLPRVPRYQQMMTIAAIILAGVIAGQWVRLARRFAEDLVRLPSKGVGK